MDELIIKVPVFVTNPLVINEDEMFGGDYESMIQNAINLINNFSVLIKRTKDKTRETIITGIDYTECNVLGRPSLLMQVKVYDTNLNDGYFEADERIEIGSKGKIGTDNNYILLYPQVEGVNAASRSCSYILLAYEDPTKENGSVAKLAKDVAKAILKQPIRNVKPEKILQDIRKMRSIPQLCIKCTSLSYNDDGDPQYQQYRSSFKLKKEKEEVFNDVPRDVAESLVENIKDNLGENEKGIVKFIQGKQQYKITISKDIKDAEEKINELGEMIFNMTASITNEELETKVHDKGFIVDRLSGVLSNFDSYVSSGLD